MRPKLHAGIATGMALLALSASAFAASAYDDDFSGSSLASKWTLSQYQVQGDIAGVPTVGNGMLTFVSGGNDFWGSADSGSMIGQQVTGNFIATVKVNQLPNLNEWSKTGLTVRSSDDASAANAAVMTTGYHGLTFQRRFADSGNTTEVQPGGGYRAPLWLGLVRYDDYAWPMVSYDGANWVAWDAGDFGFPSTVTLGIFVTAATGSGVTTAQLSDFKVQMIGSDKGTVAATVKTDGGTLPPYPAWVSVTDASGNEVAGAPTTIDGKAFVVNLAPGVYSVTASKEFYAPSAAQTITVKAGQETPIDLTIKPYPSVSLGTDSLPKEVSSTGWMSKTDQDPANPISWYDLTPAKPDYALDSSWTAQTVPGNFSPPNSTLFWYRLDFKIPADWIANYSDKDLGVGNFNVDDSDRTFLNGTDINERWGDCCRPRWDAVSQDLLNLNGVNTLAIQGLQLSGGAGFSNDNRYYAGTDAQQIPTLYVSDPTNVISGVVKDSSGQPVADVPMEIWGSGIWGKISSQTVTDSSGAYKFYGIPKGSYSVVRVAQESMAPDGSDIKQVTTKDGRNTVAQDFTVTARPSVWLIKENGFNWLSDDNSAGEDHSAVSDPDTNFVPIEISKAKGNWSQLDDYGSGGWLRLHVTFPDSWKSELGKADLRLWNFNIANNDITYFNGKRVGAMTDAYLAHRDYAIDKSLVNATGDNVIDIQGSGGAPGAFSLWRPILTLMTTPASTAKGDLNGDGSVSIQDATLSLRIAVGLIQPTADQTAAGDVNGDSKLTIQDTTLILRLAVGLVASL